MIIDASIVKDVALRINEIFCTHDVREIDFMPTVDGPHVMFAEHTLGISLTVLKPLYLHCYSMLMHVIEKVRVMETCGALSETSTRELFEEALDVTQCVLTIKGDLLIAYNLRKKALLQFPERLMREVCFLAVVFSKHPKSPSGWAHRRWCLKQRLVVHSRSSMLHTEIETERELCRYMADKYLRNYYAWMHRLWILDFMSVDQLEDELQFTRDWLLMHVSDHSAVSHRLKVIDIILSKLSPEDWQRRWSALRDDSHTLITERPGRESLWCHARGLLLLRRAQDGSRVCWRSDHISDFALKLLTLSDHCEEDCVSNSIMTRDKDALHLSWFFEELNFVLRCFAQRQPWDRDAQLSLALRYLLFIADQMCDNRTESLCTLVDSLKQHHMLDKNGQLQRIASTLLEQHRQQV